MQEYGALVRHGGNEALFTAIEMSVLAAESESPLHIHAEGLRGTGKTSLLRAAKTILPPILRIKGCLYNCHPKAPHCPLHKNLTQTEIHSIGSEWVPMPFLEISPSAKVATVAGGIDLEKLVSADSPQAALLPGTLALGHRGIVFVDEINRLADTAPELTDILLEVMGTKPGRLQIEEAGLPPVELVSLVTLWAASNPDEDPGPLEGIRRQLADRFDLCVAVRRPDTREALLAILKIAANKNEMPSGSSLADLGARRCRGLKYLPRINMAERVQAILADIYLEYGLESLRALEALSAGSKLHAALAGKTGVDEDDLISVLPQVLRHRTPPHVVEEIMQVLKSKTREKTADSVSKVVSQAAQQAESGLEDTGKSSLLSKLFGARSFESAQKTIRQQKPTPAVSGAAQTFTSRATGPMTLVSSLSATTENEISAPPQEALALQQVPEPRLVLGEGELQGELH